MKNLDLLRDSLTQVWRIPRSYPNAPSKNLSVAGLDAHLFDRRPIADASVHVWRVAMEDDDLLLALGKAWSRTGWEAFLGPEASHEWFVEELPAIAQTRPGPLWDIVGTSNVGGITGMPNIVTIMLEVMGDGDHD